MGSQRTRPSPEQSKDGRPRRPQLEDAGQSRRAGGTGAVPATVELRDDAVVVRGTDGPRAGVALRLQQVSGNRHVQRRLAEPPGAPVAQRPMTSDSGSPSPLPKAAARQIEAARGRGQPLDTTTRAAMEAALGTDLGAVRLHTDAEADELARGLNARAFTSGQDIFFRHDALDTTSATGRETLAHELGHVVQQRDGSVAPVEVASPDDPQEQAAEHFGQAVALGLRSAPPGRAEAGVVHRIFDDIVLPAEVDTRTDQQRAREAQTPSDVQAIHSFAGVSQEDRLRCIRILTDQWWIGPNDESALERLWGSFGDGLPSVAAANIGLWERSVSGGVELPIIDQVHRDFEEDVKQTAFNYMVSNRRFVREQMQRFGFSGQRGGEGGPTMTGGGGAQAMRAAGAGLGENDPIHEVQELARQVVRAEQAKTRMRQIHVGYISLPPNPQVPSRLPTRFDPDREPDLPPAGNEAEGMAPWGDVKAQWDRVEAAISGLASRSPIVFAAIQEGRTEEIARAQSPVAARNVARGLLENLLHNIEETIPKIDSGDLDWRDLRPIHDQLYRRQGRRPWNQRFFQSVARDLLSDYESREFWVSLGLGTLAAAAFIISELATGGLATALWFAGGMAISAGQAVRSWEQYEDLATAAGSAASEETRLVSSGQVSAAFVAAILDTAFAFLDAAAPGVRAARAGLAAREIAQVGAERVGLEGLARITEIGWDEAGALIHRGINELGVAETMRRTGRNADQLLAMAGRESEAGRRITAYREALEGAGTQGAGATAQGAATAAVDVQAQMRSLLTDLRAGRLTAGDADALAVRAIEEIGPQRTVELGGGWKELSRTLGNESRAGRHLRAWRDQVWSDLERYIRELEPPVPGDPNAVGIRRTGRNVQFTNDMDMSLLGPNAATNLERARNFLAGRLGTDADRIGFLLDASLLIDPRRMHLYDALPEAMRERLSRQASAREQELVYAQRLHQAREWGDAELERQIRDQMQSLGIPEVRWVRLGEADRAALAQNIDRLHGQLNEAIAAGDLARQEQLVREISERQALLNASTEGAYVTGGGVRQFVTERDQLLPAGWNPSMTPAQRLSAIVDQLPHLDEAARELVEATTPDQLAGAIKGLGKYGERVGQLGASGGPARDVFESLAERFAQLKRRAESGAVQAGLEGEADQLVQEARRVFDDLGGASGDLLRRLRAEAGLEGVEGGMAGVQRAVWAHTQLLRVKDASYWQLVSFARGVRVAAQAPGGPLSSSSAPTERNETP